jgi:hypothetical protein
VSDTTKPQGQQQSAALTADVRAQLGGEFGGKYGDLGGSEGDVYAIAHQQPADSIHRFPEFESLSLRQFLESSSVIFSAERKQVSASFARNAANTPVTPA